MSITDSLNVPPTEAGSSVIVTWKGLTPTGWAREVSSENRAEPAGADGTHEQKQRTGDGRPPGVSPRTCHLV